MSGLKKSKIKMREELLLIFMVWPLMAKMSVSGLNIGSRKVMDCSIALNIAVNYC